MIKLTSKFPIVYKGKDLVFPLTKTENTGTVYPANDAEYAEFDTYDEAKAFVESKGLSYKEFDTYDDAQAFIKEQGLKEHKASDDINYEV